jgi:hypothetical protein
MEARLAPPQLAGFPDILESIPQPVYAQLWWHLQEDHSAKSMTILQDTQGEIVPVPMLQTTMRNRALPLNVKMKGRKEDPEPTTVEKPLPLHPEPTEVEKPLPLHLDTPSAPPPHSSTETSQYLTQFQFFFGLFSPKHTDMWLLFSSEIGFLTLRLSSFSLLKIYAV